SIPGVSKSAGDSMVAMVSDGGSDRAEDEVHIAPTFLSGKRGAIAWWTSGENSKATINVDRAEKPESVVDWHERVKSNPRPDAKTFDLAKVDDLEATRRLPSTPSLRLVGDKKTPARIHDLTAYSRGLLTNTAAGGWRRDLSLFSERFGSLPSRNLPLYTPVPGEEQTYSKAPTSGNAPNPVIYPWATYRNGASGSAWMQVPPICSWTALVDYMTQYQKVNSSNASRTSMPTFIDGVGGSRFNFQDQVRRFPQIARIHWIYSLCSSRSSSPPSSAKPYRAGLMITPVVTLWNPHNVELRFNNVQLRIQQTTPLAFRFKVGGKLLQDSTLSEITRGGTGYHRFVINIGSDTLRPGETRIYGLNDPSPKTDSNAGDIRLTPGYRPNGGFMFFGINKGSDVYAAAGDSFSVDRVTYDGLTQEGGRDGVWKSGIGIIFDMIADGSSSSHRMVYNVQELGGDAVANALYPPLTASSLPSTTVGEVEGLRNRPFASAVFAYRMASPMSRDLVRHKHLFTKGMLQANPLCYYTEIGFGDDNDAITSMAGTGVYHPVNAPYDFAFQDVLGGWNDNLSIPEFEQSTKRSYIVSGMSSGDGLTRCVMAELPTRPLQSLPELQHFDARNNNPIPPFQFNLIGNGSANPIFAPDQVSVPTSFNDGMCNDDTYILNHLLFDDWFVSSIAPEIRDFRNAGGAKRSINKVYEDHLEFVEPLANRCYIPSAAAAMVDGRRDVPKAVGKALSVSKDSATKKFSFETIASKLEVEGMFNVNSVSVDAWKALLRQGRGMQVPYLGSSGRTESSGSSGFPFPRTTIAGDLGTDSGSAESSSTFPHAAEFAGYRVLTDEQIDALAEGIVSEIRRRGPFLSLSEFMNRQLNRGDKSLAIASAVQAALDALAEKGASPLNPFHVLQENSVHITSPPPGTTADYKFPEAALGWSAFGVPGWVRQADVLRPIAPVLSARDDTFTIRAYGDARDRSDSKKIIARAWCEVVVKRSADYVDPSDPCEIAPHSDEMKSDVNRHHGRRFDIVSFRWLHRDEI
ncbi:MAG: hypothetical protein KDN05_11090, partial [Verrucomicrobiae bacterium]|nr:hypothetical protein [Verrucomicrobiae bacterium]